VQVCPADPGLQHPDQDVVDADLGLGYVGERKALLGSLLDERLHAAQL
jgi:hypothetical protein